MCVQQALAILFNQVNEGLLHAGIGFALKGNQILLRRIGLAMQIMHCLQRRYLIALDLHRFKGGQLLKADARAQAGSNLLAHGSVAIHRQHALIRQMRKARLAIAQLVHRQMIGVRVRNQQRVHAGIIQMVRQHLRIGIGAKIDFDHIVQHCARAHADFLAAGLIGILAGRTITKHRRNPLRRRGTEKLKLHSNSLLRIIVLIIPFWPPPVKSCPPTV